MREPVVIPPGGGEVVGNAPDRRVEILCERAELHMTWTRFGPRRDGADLHVHHHHTDCFYVLAGELTLRLGLDGQEAPAAAGTLVRVPPGVVHGFRNGTDGELRYLNLHAPGRGFAAYMRGMRDGRPAPFDQHPPPADGGRPVTEVSVGRGEEAAAGTGLRVVALADAETIAVVEVRAEPGAAGLPDSGGRPLRCLYVLEGHVAVSAAGREVLAAAGSWVQLPPEAAVRAAGAARYLDLRAGQPSGIRGA